MSADIKNKRKLSYLINDWDDVNLPSKIDYDNIEDQVVAFFTTTSQLVFPAKSYFVAIIYAKALEKYFQVPFYEALSDNELLPDDKWFKPYNESKEIYDNILERIGDIWQYDSINKTLNYFKKEFLCN